MDSQPIAADQPPWLFGAHFNLREVCALLDVSHDTVTSWLAISKAMGALVPVVQHNRRRLTAHQALVLALLVALSRSGLPISESVIRRAVAVTHDADGNPVFPGENSVVMFSDASRGEQIVRIYIDMAAGWRGLAPKLAELFEREET